MQCVAEGPQYVRHDTATLQRPRRFVVSACVWRPVCYISRGSGPLLRRTVMIRAHLYHECDVPGSSDLSPSYVRPGLCLRKSIRVG